MRYWKQPQGYINWVQFVNKSAFKKIFCNLFRFVILNNHWRVNYINYQCFCNLMRNYQLRKQYKIIKKKKFY